jgi:predicted DNA binding CopG/RHH family protein
MTEDPQERLLGQDWAELWDTLPEAPPLVKRPAMAQITLRLPDGLRARMQRVASDEGLPYHSLARAWIIDGLRNTGESPSVLQQQPPQPEQLNLKLKQHVLDNLKQRAHELRRPYHTLARELIESALTSAEERLGITVMQPQERPVKDLMVLLLHAHNKRGEDAVRGITRMQKLLFVLEQTLVPTLESRFYAHNFGPFSESVYDAAESLRSAGLLSGSERPGKGPPSFAEMMASAKRPPIGESEISEEFALSDVGHDAAERLVHSNPAYERLFQQVSKLRTEWDTPDLIERVYETWPEQTEKSLIRDEVAERRQRRRSQ